MYKHICYISIIMYLCCSCFITNNFVSRTAVAMSAYFLLKWLTNYRKCTISYIECKLRGVKKEEGFIYNLLEPIIDLNKSDWKDFIYAITFVILITNYWKKTNI
jgi:hypothetical protein